MPKGSRKHTRHRAAMAAVMARQRFQAPSTRKDFFSSISATKKPAAVQIRAHRVRARGSS